MQNLICSIDSSVLNKILYIGARLRRQNKTWLITDLVSAPIVSDRRQVDTAIIIYLYAANKKARSRHMKLVFRAKEIRWHALEDTTTFYFGIDCDLTVSVPNVNLIFSFAE